ncbi:hypothetical protein BB561_000823 [Smittium simulii]|uniref:Peroxin-19 n=1 Tax=Smittium simulii TaxID=133385 RepID=A0A2T9YXC1_9FUNG|nr:hypothetical protein BB561_000823 [Smittium simulii]
MSSLTDNEFDALLDDALDDYSKTSTLEAAKNPTPSVPSTDKELAQDISKAFLDSLKLDSEQDLDLLAKEFAENLQKNMGDFLDTAPEQAQTKKSVEDMLAELTAIGSKIQPDIPSYPETHKAAPPALSHNLNSSSTKSTKPISLQDKIKTTVDLMNENHKNTDTNSSSLLENDFFSGLADQNNDLDGLINDKELEEMLQQVMKEMSSKDILYEPMSKLLVEYPKFFESKGKSISSADMDRYQKQYQNISKLVQLFDQADHESESAKAEIAQLLQNTQELGEPPNEILESISPDFTQPNSDLPPNFDQEQCSIM